MFDGEVFAPADQRPCLAALGKLFGAITRIAGGCRGSLGEVVGKSSLQTRSTSISSTNLTTETTRLPTTTRVGRIGTRVQLVGRRIEWREGISARCRHGCNQTTRSLTDGLRLLMIGTRAQEGSLACSGGADGTLEAHTPTAFRWSWWENGRRIESSSQSKSLDARVEGQLGVRIVVGRLLRQLKGVEEPLRPTCRVVRVSRCKGPCLGKGCDQINWQSLQCRRRARYRRENGKEAHRTGRRKRTARIRRADCQVSGSRREALGDDKKK